MHVEKALISRAIHNLMSNSVLHNKGCTVTIKVKNVSNT